MFQFPCPLTNDETEILLRLSEDIVEDRTEQNGEVLSNRMAMLPQRSRVEKENYVQQLLLH